MNCYFMVFTVKNHSINISSQIQIEIQNKFLVGKMSTVTPKTKRLMTKRINSISSVQREIQQKNTLLRNVSHTVTQT